MSDEEGMSERVGMCSECKEWTDVDDPCCGAAVYYEGAMWSPEDEGENDISVPDSDPA